MSKKISELPAATSATGADEIPVNEAGTTKKLTVNQLIQFTLTPITLVDGATPALDASLGNVFLLTSTQNPTIAVPSNPTNGQKIIIVFKAQSGGRTLSLNASGFSFGTDITALSATTSSLTDYIGCIYNSGIGKWMVVSYIKGFS